MIRHLISLLVIISISLLVVISIAAWLIVAWMIIFGGSLVNDPYFLLGPVNLVLDSSPPMQDAGLILSIILISIMIGFERINKPYLIIMVGGIWLFLGLIPSVIATMDC